MNNLSCADISSALESLESGYAPLPASAEEIIARALRELLALREAGKEPVAFMYRDRLHKDARFSYESKIGNWSPEDISEYEITETKLYAAAQLPAVPEGWVMVPKEPTAEMISSGISAHYDRSKIQIHDRPAAGPMECAYAAMIAAAPQLPAKAESCLWSSNDEGVWEGQCGLEWQFFDGDSSPQDNGAKFCPRCGGLIAAAPKPE